LSVITTDTLFLLTAGDANVKQQEDSAKLPEAAQEAAEEDELDIQLDEDVRLQLISAHLSVFYLQHVS
jgi:hypothetical protein